MAAQFTDTVLWLCPKGPHFGVPLYLDQVVEDICDLQRQHTAWYESALTIASFFLFSGNNFIEL